MTLIEPETPETLLIQKENHAELYIKIKRLPRAGIMMFFILNFNCKKTGRKFNLTGTRIKQIVIESLKLLKKRLKKNYFI